jgi:hypothetical protein
MTQLTLMLLLEAGKLMIVLSATTRSISSTAMTKATSLYSTYHNIPQCILPRHKYLFTNKTLAQRLSLDIDSLNCWIRSVQDAIQALTHHVNQQRLSSNCFFAPFLAAGRKQRDTSIDSHDSNLLPSISS